MTDLTINLATDSNGIDINIGQVQAWLLTRDKKKLSELFYDRFYGRYIRPFDYPSELYIKKYKNGFSIMTNCCLLIETFVSWTEPTLRNTNKNSERCFGYFFLKEKRFNELSKGGATILDYTTLSKKITHKGTACDFYHNVRCGLLHNGETKNGWKITRVGNFYDENSKRINAVKFMKRLAAAIRDFKKRLDVSDFDKSVEWITYKNRLSDLIKKSYLFSVPSESSTSLK